MRCPVVFLKAVPLLAPQRCFCVVLTLCPDDHPQVDTAFTVRIKIRVPPHGLGKVLDECFRWLNDNVGTERFSQAATAKLGTSATAFYFLCLEDFLSFLNAFTELETADGTVSPAYSSPKL